MRNDRSNIAGPIVRERICSGGLSGEFMAALKRSRQGAVTQVLYYAPRTTADFLLATAIRLSSVSGLGGLLQLQRGCARDWREIDWVGCITSQEESSVHLIVRAAQGQAREIMRWANCWKGKRQEFDRYLQAEKAFDKFDHLLDVLEGVDEDAEVQESEFFTKTRRRV